MRNHLPAVASFGAAALLAACFNSSSGGATGDAGFGDSGIDFDGGGDVTMDTSTDSTTPGEGGGDSSTSTDAGHDGAPTDGTVADVVVPVGDGGPVYVAPTQWGYTFGAASADGTAMIVVGAAGLWWSHFDPASGWSAPAQVPGSGTSQTAALDMDGSGNAFLVWPVDVDGGAVYWQDAVSRYDHASNTWSAPVFPVDTGAASVSQSPAVSVNTTGDALVFDIGVSGPNVPAKVAHYSGGTWTSETVDPAVNIRNTPLVKLADNGLAVAVVSDGNGTHIATRSAGGTWTIAAPVISTAYGKFDLTINPAGDVLVGYINNGTAPAVVQYDAAGGMWSGPTNLSTESEASGHGQAPTNVALTATGDGVLTRAYYGSTGNSVPVLEAFPFTKSSKTWGAVQLANIGTAYMFNFEVAFNASGVGLAAYQNFMAAGNQSGDMQASIYTIGTGWGPPSAGFGTNVNGQVAAFISASGHAWTAYGAGTSTYVEQVQ